VERGIFDVEKGIFDVERGIFVVGRARSVLERSGKPCLVDPPEAGIDLSGPRSVLPGRGTLLATVDLPGGN